MIYLQMPNKCTILRDRGVASRSERRVEIDVILKTRGDTVGIWNKRGTYNYAWQEGEKLITKITTWRF